MSTDTDNQHDDAQRAAGTDDKMETNAAAFRKRIGDSDNATMSSLHLPKHLHLKGEDNFLVWRTHIINVAKSNNLELYISQRHQKLKPKYVDFDDMEASAEEYEAWSNWDKGDAKMKMAITHNCNSTPAGLINNCTTAMEMWLTLQRHYEGSGVVLEYQAITTYTNLRYEDFSSLESFIIAFKKSIEKLQTLKIQPPEKWHPIMFIAALAPAWPMCAERQRSLARTKEYIITLEALIADITDEARNTNKDTKGGGSTALFGNQTRGTPANSKKNKGNKGGTDKKCKHCGKPHNDDDCFTLPRNKAKKEAWEKKVAERKKNGGRADKGKKESKRSDSDSEDENKMLVPTGKKGMRVTMSCFNLRAVSQYSVSPAEANQESLTSKYFFPCARPATVSADDDDSVVEEIGRGSYITDHQVLDLLNVTKLSLINQPYSYSSIFRNLWNFDTGTSEHISNSLAQFSEYHEIANLPPFNTANGPVVPSGMGTVTLQCPLPGGIINELVLTNVYYLPGCGVCLFSGKRFLANGGKLGTNNTLYTKKVKGQRYPMCMLDDDLFIINDMTHFSYPVLTANPAALEKAKIDIKLWHRRYGHVSFDTIRASSKATKGLDFKEGDTIPEVSITCDPCEKGKPYRVTRKKAVRDIVVNPGEIIHLDVVKLSPAGIHGEVYGVLGTCEASSCRFFGAFAQKKEAFSYLKTLCRHFKRQFDKFPKRFRIDGGKEYSPSQLAQLADDLGQVIETTTPYTPNQDGKSEISIRIITERVR